MVLDLGPAWAWAVLEVLEVKASPELLVSLGQKANVVLLVIKANEAIVGPRELKEKGYS